MMRLFGRKEKVEAGLKKSREGLFGRITRLFDRATVDEAVWEELEEGLVSADVGLALATSLLARVKQRSEQERAKSGEAVRGILQEEMARVLEVGKSGPPRLAPTPHPGPSRVRRAGSLPDGERADERGGSYGRGLPRHYEGEGEYPLISAAPLPAKPYVVLVVGVNGVGKTTSIAKLANLLSQQGRSVVLAAADTFRAAAVEQLQIWAKRANVQIVAHQMGSDPGAVTFDALQAAKARGADVVLIDTAGRLHTKSNLMEELKKVQRVIKRFDPTAPHETMLVLDATTGQNGLLQAKSFTEAVGVDGLFLAKLDGTARGGITLAIADQLHIPIRFIGTGEQMDDIAPFNAQEFVAALFARAA